MEKVKLVHGFRKLLSKTLHGFSRRVRPAPPARRTSAFLFFLFACFLVWEPGAKGQASRIISVREATDYQGDQPISGRLGQNVTVEGILINGPISVGADSGLADLEDSTGGITLYSPGRVLFARHIRRGDKVRVSGTIRQYEGQTELLVRQIDRLGPGTLPSPRDVLAANLSGTRYLGQLVRMEGKVRVTKNTRGQPQIILSDRSGQFPIYVGRALLEDAQLTRRLFAGGPATVVGIPTYSQSAKGPATRANYLLILRDPADFAFRPVPPYQLIAVSLLFLFCILAATYLILRRRSAEQRAQKMAVLLENLNQSEKALRQSEQRYRLLFDHNLAGLYCSTLDGHILDCNDSFVRMFGYTSREEIMGKSGQAQELYSSPAERTAFISALQEKKVLTNLEMCLRTKDGRQVWVLENASLLHRGGDLPALVEGTLVDITERKNLEEQFRQAQKMEAIGQLTGGIAHDFNNLLTIIKGNSELLLDRIDLAQPLYKSVHQIKKSADQAAALIRQLLAFSRMQVLQPRVLDLNSVVAETGKILPRLLREDIEVVLVPGASLDRVKADPNQIEQIILNLAVNARDAMPGGGKLIVETANVDLDESYARLHPSVKPGQYVLLAITDTGTGMAAETQAHIFEPFFTTKEARKGTGLGLATVYGIVKQSGGWIWVYSEPGQGTAFKIYLPKVADVIPADSASSPRAATPHGTETILLAEDQIGIRDLVRPFLEDIGYTVLEASDGEAALRIAQQHRGQIDLLLTDIVMPKMGGHQLAQQTAALHPHMKVLYMSGYAEYATSRAGNSHAGELALQKPFSMDALAIKVREVLSMEQSAPSPAELAAH